MRRIPCAGVVAVLSLFCMAGLSACAGGDQDGSERGASDQAELGYGNELWGTSWRLEALGDTEAMEDAEATLSFPEEGSVQGMASCNRFTGTVTVAGDSISFGPLAVTKMACPDPVMAQEDRFLEALRNATVFDRRDPFLFIHAAWESPPLRLTREK